MRMMFMYICVCECLFYMALCVDFLFKAINTVTCEYA